MNRALKLLTDPKTLRAGAGVLYPTVMAAVVGISGTVLSLILAAVVTHPWDVSKLTWPVGLLLLVVLVGFPVLYFILGGRYGVTRAALGIYDAARPAVVDLVLAQIVEQRQPSPSPAQSAGSSKAVKWLVKVIMNLGGIGDRLADAVLEIDKHAQPATVIVGAMLDDLLIQRLVEPARNAIIFAAIGNAVAIAGLAFMVRS
jgi:hypothetical protein